VIPAIGMIIAVYAVARLLQVPIEQSREDNRQWLLWTVSLVAILAIVWFSVGILTSSSEVADMMRKPFGK